MPERIIHDMNTSLKTKFMLGREYPYFRLVDDILEGWEEDVKFCDGVQELFYYKNAVSICPQTEDQREGIRFTEKRKPVFIGR